MSLFWFRRPVFQANELKRVLLIHPFGIGDALFMTPVIRSLKEGGVKQIDLLLGSRTRELFEHNPRVNHVFEWDKTRVDGTRLKWRQAKESAKLFWALWRNHYQVVIDFSPTAQYAFLSCFVFWIPVRIGFHFMRRGFFLTHGLDLADGFSAKSVIEYYLDLLKFLNLEKRDDGEDFNRNRCRTELFLNEEDRDACDVLLKKLGLDGNQPFLAVAPGGGESWGKDARLKRWPVANFDGLIRNLRRDPYLARESVLILGGKTESGLCSELALRLHDIPHHNLSGVTSLRVAALLIEKASLLLANDGGLVHLAHATGTPIIALYGPVDPLVYGPYPPGSKALAIQKMGPACRPCYHRFRYQSECQGVECLTELTVEDVLEQIRSERFLEKCSLNSATR